MDRRNYAEYLRLNSIYRTSLRAAKKAGKVREDGENKDDSDPDDFDGETCNEDERPSKKGARVTKDVEATRTNQSVNISNHCVDLPWCNHEILVATPGCDDTLSKHSDSYSEFRIHVYMENYHTKVKI